MKKRFDKATVMEFISDLPYVIIGAMLYSAGVYSFAVAGNFAPGGIAGLTIIINHYFRFIPIGFCSLVINIPIIIFTYKTLGKKFFAKSVVSMVIVAIVLDWLFPMLPTYNGNQLLAALFAGSLSGIGLSIIYMRGSSTGGTDFIILALRKKNPHISIGNITMIIDGCVLILNGIVFGNIEAVLYGGILTYVCTMFIDKMMYKSESRKKVSIITTKGIELGRAISDKTGRGVTLINAVGAYSGEKCQFLIYICAGKHVHSVKDIATSVDMEALIFVDTADEVSGRKIG